MRPGRRRGGSLPEVCRGRVRSDGETSELDVLVGAVRRRQSLRRAGRATRRRDRTRTPRRQRIGAAAVCQRTSAARSGGMRVDRGRPEIVGSRRWGGCRRNRTPRGPDPPLTAPPRVPRDHAWRRRRDDWVGTPPEGRHSRDRADPGFWQNQWQAAAAGAGPVRARRGRTPRREAIVPAHERPRARGGDGRGEVPRGRRGRAGRDRRRPHDGVARLSSSRRRSETRRRGRRRGDGAARRSTGRSRRPPSRPRSRPRRCSSPRRAARCLTHARARPRARRAPAARRCPASPRTCSRA